MLNIIRGNYRSWWQVPRKAGMPHSDRRVSFLETFFDLVYVVLIAQLAHKLSENVNLASLAGFVFLYAFIIFAWVNGTLYHDLHGNNDIKTRFFMFLQMLSAGAMSIFINSALGEGYLGFSLSYLAFLVIITYMWWRTGIHDPDHRLLSKPFCTVYILSILIFFSSIFVPVLLRFVMWAISLILCMSVPLILFLVSRNNKKARLQLDKTYTFSPAAAERMGLFVIILLGQAIVSVVQRVVSLGYLDWSAGISTLFGMVLVILMWWLYFDFISNRLPSSKAPERYIWLYLHMPATVSIALAGAGLLNSVANVDFQLPTEIRWLLLVSISLFLITLAFLTKTVQLSQKLKKTFDQSVGVLLISGVGCLILGFFNLNTISLFISTIVIMFLPVIFASRVSILDSRKY